MDAASRLLAARRAITGVLPVAAMRSLGLTPIPPRAFDEILARASTVYAPIFLPVYEGERGLYCVHLSPGRRWRGSPWILLAHDDTCPRLVATSLATLPGALLLPPHGAPERYRATWPMARAVSAAIDSPPPPREPYKGVSISTAAVKALIDPTEPDAALSVATVDATTSARASHGVQKLFEASPDDTLLMLAEAARRASFGDRDPQDLAFRVLEREVSWGPCYPLGSFLTTFSAAPELLEIARVLAEPRLAGTPFAPLLKASYFEPATAHVLAQIAKKLPPERALVQLRNAVTLAGAGGGGLDRSWCELLATASEDVAPEGLSAALASRAALVRR